MTKENKNIDPLEYFNDLKSKKHKWNTEKLKLLQENTSKLLQKAYSLGQESVCKKLLFNVDVIQKEKKLFDLGVDTFIYKDDVLHYIGKVADEAVKIIELKKYPREIPDEISEKIIELKKKKIFDEYVIVFTDYTGEAEREVAKERRRKDPILFGVFKKDDNIIDRFYFLGDWEDEYCDLTLDKMVEEMSSEGIEIKHSVEQNVEIEEIRGYINRLVEKSNSFTLSVTAPRKLSIFNKVKLWLKK